MRKAEQILRFIKKSGTKGRRFTDIQRFIFNVNKPHIKFDPVHDRGYYCNPLCGSYAYDGLLSYCKKNKNRRWTLNALPKGRLYK